MAAHPFSTTRFSPGGSRTRDQATVSELQCDEEQEQMRIYDERDGDGMPREIYGIATVALPRSCAYLSAPDALYLSW